jgi:Metallo-peptidase family M12B Reprolysin-like
MRNLLLLPVLILSFAAHSFVHDRARPELFAGVSGQKPQMTGGLTSESKTRVQEGKRSPDGLWQEISVRDPEKSLAEDKAAQKSYRRLRLDQATRTRLLRLAPPEFTKAARLTPLIITLPLPDGTFMRFGVAESPIMESALAARFPNIKTYRGKGLDDQTALARFDWTPTGLHAILLSQRGTAFIEPEAAGDTSTYISYYERNLPEGADSFECSTIESVEPSALSKARSAHGLRASGPLVASGGTLRTYRLALAATAEFTQTYGGGTTEGALTVVTTNINFVNAIYERDLAIRLILVANETNIIFTNAATDGYTSDVIDTMYQENQSVLDRLIGAGNYDIGHVFDGHSTFGPRRYYFQGRAELASACINGRKGKGVSIFRSLEPSTTSAVYVVAHEMGHQFGAGHTFNGTTADCGGSRMAATAYEPGSGSTIMGYRGTAATNASYFPICDEEDLHSTDTYFHAASLEQIINYTTFGNGSICPVQTETGNTPPAVSAATSFNIPRSTPFMLTATGSDSDGDTLTYAWEEYDLGAPSPPNTDNGNRPIFRSFAPTASPSRTFPQLSDILSGTQTFGESLPTTTRTMRFRVTVRDNHAGSGGVNTGSAQLAVHSGSGPFIVTEPSFSTSWQAGSSQTVNWDVANTSVAPVSCANVRISLSTDGGNTFPIILAESTPNDGAATIAVPYTPTSTARVKVEAIGNIFFNISLPNFTITTPAGATPPQLLTEENSNRAAALDSVTFMRDPFPLMNVHNFSPDRRTRILLFAVNLELASGEDYSTVTAQAEDAAHRIHPLQVEYVGKVPHFDWLTQVVVKLPDTIAGAGEVWVSISFRGVASNKALLRV